MPPGKRAAGGKIPATGATPTTTTRKKKEKAEVRHAQTTLAQFFSSPKSSNRGYDGQPSPSSSNKRLGVDMRIGDNVSDAEGVCGEGSEECGSTPSKIEKDVGHSSSDNRASENALQEVDVVDMTMSPDKEVEKSTGDLAPEVPVDNRVKSGGGTRGSESSTGSVDSANEEATCARVNYAKQGTPEQGVVRRGRKRMRDSGDGLPKESSKRDKEVSNSNGAAVEDDAVVPYQALEQVKVETPSEREEASHSRVKNKGNSCSSESSARGGLGTDKYGCKRDSPDDEPRETEHASRREPTSNGHCHGGKASIGSSEMGGVMKGDGIGPSGGSVSAVPESGWSRNIADGTFVKAADASAVIDALEGGNASEDSEGGGSSGSRELEHSTSRGEDATDMGRYDGGEHDENVADEEHVHPAADVSAGISVCMPTAEAAAMYLKQIDDSRDYDVAEIDAENANRPSATMHAPAVKSEADLLPKAPAAGNDTIDADGVSTPSKGKWHKKGCAVSGSSAAAQVTPHPQLRKYLDRLAVLVANAEAGARDEERPDRRMGLQEAQESATAAAVAVAIVEKGDNKGDIGGGSGDGAAIEEMPIANANKAFPELLAPLLARVVQGSSSPLSKLSEEALHVLKELAPEQARGLTASKIAEKISLVAHRKCYGAQPKKAIIPEDTSPEAVWRWEVQLMDLLPADKAGIVKQARSERTYEGKVVKALVKLTEVMTRHPEDASKISKEEEKVMAFARKEEALRQKASMKEAGLAVKERARREKEESREKERKAKEEGKKKKQELKEAKKAEEKRIKAAVEEERKKQERKKQEEAKLGTVSLFNFFKVTEASHDCKENVAPTQGDEYGSGRLCGSPGRVGHYFAGNGEHGAGGSIVGGDGDGGECGGGGRPGDVGGGGGGTAWGGGVDVGGGGAEGRKVKSEGGFDVKQLETFERRLKEGGVLEDLLAFTAREGGQRTRKRKGMDTDEVQVIRPKRIKVTVTVDGGGSGFGHPVFSEERQVEVRNRMKLLQFHQDYRPPYWGTWSKTSKDVTGRRPLGRDSQGLLNYDCDSEEDWEEDEAQGEDLLSDEEGDKEPEDNLDYKDGWLRQDDEFSDEEKDRFGDGDDDEDGTPDVNQSRRPTTSFAGNSQSTAAFGAGVGVRVGAGASAGGAGAMAAASAGGAGQGAFLAALMFRQEHLSEEEMRAQPALRALSAYRAVPFCGGEGGAGAEMKIGKFPVAVLETLMDKPRRNDMVEVDGEECAMDGRRDDKCRGRPRKHKDVPDELLPSLVDKLHGKADKREDVVNAFVAEHPMCTKKAVHQKVKDIATRERALFGGKVFVVSAAVLESLGVEKEELSLRPTCLGTVSPIPETPVASITATATAQAKSPEETSDKMKGMAQAKHLPPPGQRSLLSFLNPVAKDIQDSCTEQLHLSSQAGLKVPLSPSSGSEARASSLPTVEDATAAIPQPVSGKDSMEVDDKLSMESNEVSNEGDASTERTTVTQSVADEKRQNHREEAAIPNGGERRRGPDESGGWEEVKESEPPMGKPVPFCKILTPSKKVRRVAAARPVLYMGSGPPPPLPRAIAMKDGDDEGNMPAITATVTSVKAPGRPKRNTGSSRTTANDDVSGADPSIQEIDSASDRNKGS